MRASGRLCVVVCVCVQLLLGGGGGVYPQSEAAKPRPETRHLGSGVCGPGFKGLGRMQALQPESWRLRCQTQSPEASNPLKTSIPNSETPKLCLGSEEEQPRTTNPEPSTLTCRDVWKLEILGPLGSGIRDYRYPNFETHLY